MTDCVSIDFKNIQHMHIKCMYNITLLIVKEWIMPDAKAISVKMQSHPYPPTPFSNLIMITK